MSHACNATHRITKIPNNKFRVIQLGIGIISRISSIKDINIVLASNYYESIWMNKSNSGFHKNTRSITISVQLEYEFKLFNMKIMPMIAPIFDMMKFYNTPLKVRKNI